MNSSQNLSQAIHAVANDERQKARDFVEASFSENNEPECVEAWLIQAWTCNSMAQAMESLNNALAANPQHEGAKAGLKFFNELKAACENSVQAERMEAERLEQERLEAERLEQERLEAERLEQERLEAERLEAERLEAERLEAERLEAERLEQERLEQERLEAERLEQERLEAERLEAERLEAERLEQERLEQERLETERLEQERLEAERLEAERLEQERLEAERVAAEAAAAAQAEQEAQAAAAEQVDELQESVESLVNEVQQEVAPVPAVVSSIADENNDTAPAEPSDASNNVILAVDDSPTIRKLVSITLREQGYEVVTASDGIEALNILAESLPALVLSDINMPRLGGYKLCKFIKKHERTANIPVVMLSGKDGVFDKMRGKMNGADGFIAKPFNAEDLIAVVQEHCPAPAQS